MDLKMVDKNLQTKDKVIWKKEQTKHSFIMLGYRFLTILITVVVGSVIAYNLYKQFYGI